MKLDEKDISWDDLYLVYKGVKLPLTRENIEDYKFQTGMDPIDLIEYTYNSSLSVLRDKKLNELLDE